MSRFVKARLVGRVTTLNILRVVFPVLLLVCTIALLQVLSLFGVGPILAHLSWAIPLLVSIVYLYTGLHVDDPESLPKVRQFFRTHVLDSLKLLLTLCLVLLSLLVIVTLLGASSETVVFVSANKATVQVQKLDGEEAHPLGTASASTPLKKRFFSGTHHFKVSSEGYDPQTKEISVGVSTSNLLNGTERRVPLELHPTANFVLRGMGTGYFLAPPLPREGFPLPDRLEARPTMNLTLSLASSSPTPFWIQNIYLRVVDVRPLKESTFPWTSGQIGAGGEPPIPGYAELRAEPGLYPVTLKTKAKLGRGIDPSDFTIDVFCEPGYQYLVRPEVHWLDLNAPKREGDYPFNDVAELDIPTEYLKWEDLVAASREEVKIFVNTSAEYLTTKLQALEPLPNYTILNGDHTIYEFERIAQISISDTETFTEIIAKLRRKYYGDDPYLPLFVPPDVRESMESAKDYPPNFIIIDGRVLLLEDGWLRAEIIEDSGQIAEIEEAYDAAAERAGLGDFVVRKDEVPTIKSSISGFYEAMGAGNLEKAYSYLGPTERNLRDELDSWTASGTAFQLRGTTIETLELGDIEEHRATATVKVQWQDNFPNSVGDRATIDSWNLVKEDREWKLDEVSSRVLSR